MTIDFKKIFEKLPGNYLVVKSNTPDFTLVAVTDSHLHNIGVKREHFVGEKLFDLFPDLSGNMEVVRDAIKKVIEKKESVAPEIMRYDIPVADSGRTTVKYWKLDYTPIFDEDMDVAYIVQRSTDITDLVETGGLKAPDKK